LKLLMHPIISKVYIDDLDKIFVFSFCVFFSFRSWLHFCSYVNYYYYFVLCYFMNLIIHQIIHKFF
jgi:hypothetical protein